METPYYLVSEKTLSEDVNLLLESFKGNWNNFICGYSVKTNSLPWVLSFLRKKDFYAEIVSESEYKLVKQIGYEDNKIIYNSPIKNKSIFYAIILNEGIVNIDSFKEISYLNELAPAYPDKKIKIGIRVNCDYNKISQNEESTEDDGSRFGFSYYNGDFDLILNNLKKYTNIEIIGLHLHAETKSRSIEGYCSLVDFAGKIANEKQLNLKYVDLGGGFFGGLENKPNFKQYIPQISQHLRNYFNEKETTLIVEPGVSLIAHSFEFVTSVKEIKNIDDKVYVITDGSRVNLNPMSKAKKFMHYLKLSDNILSRSKKKRQIICGYTCMESDRIFELNNEIEFLPNDQIIYKNAGAYTICMTPLFINFFPAVYVKKQDNSIFTAREAWTELEFLEKNSYE